MFSYDFSHQMVDKKSDFISEDNAEHSTAVQSQVTIR